MKAKYRSAAKRNNRGIMAMAKEGVWRKRFETLRLSAA